MASSVVFMSTRTTLAQSTGQLFLLFFVNSAIIGQYEMLNPPGLVRRITKYISLWVSWPISQTLCFKC